MNLTFERVDSLPRLAWCAEIRPGLECRVMHGPWVEAREDFFVEGAWDGPFAEGRFDQSCLVMGSGGRTATDGLLFCTASHTLERLHYLQSESRLLISPSMVFILTVAGRRLDMGHIPYQVELAGMVKSLEHHVGSIPLEGGGRLNLAFYRNLLVDAELNVKVLPKAEPPEFGTFKDYSDYLVQGLRAIARNAADSYRQVKFSPVTTVSSGYDSAACAALSKEIGCRTALTFLSAWSQSLGTADLDDSGQPVGEALGLEVKTFSRLAYHSKEGFPEAEFVVCGDLGQDMPFSGMEGDLEQRLVLIGTHGDIIWDRHFVPHGRDIVRKFMDGCSLIEFKARTGFIYVVPPFFGAMSHPSIYAISNSEEMRPWQVGGKYDRPIPRRIAEDAGVKRGLFGCRKSAVAVLLNRDRRLRLDMKPDSFADFETFYQANKHRRPWAVQKLYDVMFALYGFYHAVVSRVPLARRIPCPIPARFREPPGRSSFLVHWAFGLVRNRYEGAAANLAKARPVGDGSSLRPARIAGE